MTIHGPRMAVSEPPGPISGRWSRITRPARDPTDFLAARFRAAHPPVDFAALVSGHPGGTDSRWSLFPQVSQTIVVYEDATSFLRSLRPQPGERAFQEAYRNPEAPPFVSGWVVALGYGCGTEVEPRARDSRASARARADAAQAGLPLVVAMRFDRAIAHDGLTDTWWSMGVSDEPLAAPAAPGGRPWSSGTFRLGSVRARVGWERFIATVERARELIRAGDVYQVNLAHALEASFEGSPLALFDALLSVARPWHGAFMEFADARGERISICSASPECFLRYDPVTRRVVTRPMKGTRSLGEAGAREDLEHSPKDRAELAMIIDLMRNDLGRSCVLGSVRVDESRCIERHASADGRGLYQATGTVSGTLRADRSPLDLVWSAFPPGSVTGAPKIRAMQIIDELEPDPRGFYCGTIGYIGDDGAINLNVAIRTATIRRGTLTYPVGAGIVADSDPEAEWNETLAKAWPLRRVAGSEGPGCEQVGDARN